VDLVATRGAAAWQSSRVRLATISSVFSVACLLGSGVAMAGGLVLPARGVRSLARGGAFVAGADDADALWLNPAGLAHGAGANKRTLLFDLAVVYQEVEHARVDAAGTPFPAVSNEQPSQLAPTIAGALGINDVLVIAGGIAAPYASVHRYPGDGPQRFASVSQTRSTVMIVAVGVALRVSDRLRVGATLQDVFTKIASSIVVSGCPGTMTCAPDDRSFDMRLELEQTDALAPSGSIGVQYDATERVTVGLALQAPSRVSATGTLAATLPTATVFEGAMVTGDDATLAYTLPPTVRAGVEVDVTASLRAEAALDVELWSMHDEVTLDPGGIRVEGVAGQGALELATMTIPRDAETSFAPSIGIEWHGPQLVLGAGYAYETAAIPAATVSVAAVDAAKHLVALGGGYEDAGWQIGAAVGLVALADVTVAPADARVPQLAPLQAANATTGVNAGSYASTYLLAGLRFARRW